MPCILGVVYIVCIYCMFTLLWGVWVSVCVCLGDQLRGDPVGSVEETWEQT